VHQEFRVLRRMLNIAVRKKLLAANPCSGVEFPVSVKGLFRAHYVTWSVQGRIESHGPEYLRNVVRIITETGLRVYKELAPMRKDQVDLSNAVVWVPDSKTPNGIAEVPLTPWQRKRCGAKWQSHRRASFSFRVIAIGYMGNADAAPGRRASHEEVLSDEVADEA
jgi:integrase